MLTKHITVRCREGLHLRPAQRLSAAMAGYDGSITVIYQDKHSNGKSLLSLLTAGIPCSAAVTVVCDGKQEQEMLQAARRILQAEDD